jgi:hypothetical protein
VCYPRNPLLDLQNQLAGIQRLSIGSSEEAQLYEEGLGSRASEIKEFEEPAEPAMRKHIIPPRIVPRSGHVVRHDVEQDAQALQAGSLYKATPCRFTTKIVADPRRIRYVISMLAAGDRLETGRQIHMTDSQFGQVLKDQLRRTQRKSFVQLQAIGRNPSIAHD